MISPDAYLGEPWGYAVNQLGHMALGAGLALFLPWWLVLAGYAAWEAYQVRSGGLVFDAFEDAAFVAAGVAALTFPPVLGVAALFLCSGFAGRWND